MSRELAFTSDDASNKRPARCGALPVAHASPRLRSPRPATSSLPSIRAATSRAILHRGAHGTRKGRHQRAGGMVDVMSPSAARRMHWSESEYLAMESESPIKHEFQDGEVFAMAGARPSHNVLASGALGALVALVRGGKCRVFNSDQRIYIPATGLYTYADGGVAWGRWDLHADGLCLRNPVLLVEVLSPSTRDYDRGAKMDHYCQLASLRHVLLIDDPERLVEHHRRGDDGAWSKTELRVGNIDLADLGGSLALDDVYLASEI